MIKLKATCTIPGTNQLGKYSRFECETPKESTPQSVCYDEYCQTFYCCATEPLDIFCKPTSNQSLSDLTEIISKKCYDSIRKINGVCRPRDTCPKLFGKEVVSCGEDCCTEFVCCPDDDFSSMRVSQQSIVFSFDAIKMLVIFVKIFNF